MTHHELCQRAVKWLRDSVGCWIVLSEQSGGPCSEIPDAIGWSNGASILVECKVSIEDLKADRLKPSRKHRELGMGAQRFYMVPKELEEQSRMLMIGTDRWSDVWGLLVCHPKQIKMAIRARGWHDSRHERTPQVSILGKWYEEQMLLATLERLAFRLSPITLSEFLRMPGREMRGVSLRDGEPPKEEEAAHAG